MDRGKRFHAGSDEAHVEHTYRDLTLIFFLVQARFRPEQANAVRATKSN